MIIGLAGKHGAGKTMLSRMLLEGHPRISRLDVISFYLSEIFNIQNFDLKNVSIYDKQELKKLANINFNNPTIYDIQFLFNEFGIFDNEKIKKYTDSLQKFFGKNYDDAINLLIEITNSIEYYNRYCQLLKKQFLYIENKYQIVIYYIYNYDEAINIKNDTDTILVYIDIDNTLASYLTEKDKALRNLEKLEEFERIKNISDYIINNEFQPPTALIEKFRKVIHANMVK